MNNQNTWNLNAGSFTPRTSGQRGADICQTMQTTRCCSKRRETSFSANCSIYSIRTGTATRKFSGGGRRLNEAGSRYFSYDNTSYSATGGLRGDLDLGGRNWQWDAYYQNHRATEAQHLYQRILSPLRLSLGVDVTVDPVTGEARCTNPFVGCVPVNFLGLDSVTPEMAAFLTPDKGDQQFFDRSVFQASMNGESVRHAGRTGLVSVRFRVQGAELPIPAGRVERGRPEEGARYPLPGCIE